MLLFYSILILSLFTTVGIMVYIGKKDYCESLEDLLEVADMGMFTFVIVYLLATCVVFGVWFLLYGLIFMLGILAILKILTFLVLCVIIAGIGAFGVDWLLKYKNSEEE